MAPRSRRRSMDLRRRDTDQLMLAYVFNGSIELRVAAGEEALAGQFHFQIGYYAAAFNDHPFRRYGLAKRVDKISAGGELGEVSIKIVALAFLSYHVCAVGFLKTRGHLLAGRAAAFIDEYYYFALVCVLVAFRTVV